jgi:NADH:ubiquinone oxidoreductase subunit K
LSLYWRHRAVEAPLVRSPHGADRQLLVLSYMLFLIGSGVLFRRSATVIFISIELMLNAVNLVRVCPFMNTPMAVFVMFISPVAAASGRAINRLFRQQDSVDVKQTNP